MGLPYGNWCMVINSVKKMEDILTKSWLFVFNFDNQYEFIEHVFPKVNIFFLVVVVFCGFCVCVCVCISGQLTSSTADN